MDSDDEVSYDSLTLSPLLFIDDLFRRTENVEAAHAGMIKMEQLAESKILDYNLTKTNYIVFGNKKKKEKIEKELESNPLKLYGSQINQSKCEKYLGWYISEESLSDCSFRTVMKRKGKVTNAILQIKAIIEDSRCERIGALKSALNIWECSVVPFLLYFAGYWIKIGMKTLKTLNDLQNDFSLPLSMPIPILYFDTKSLLMANRIWKMKIHLLFHLKNLPPTSLAKEVLILQRNHHLPGLHEECQEMLNELKIGDMKSYSKTQFKKELNKRIEEKNLTDLLRQIKSYKKLNHKEVSEEEYELKS